MEDSKVKKHVTLAAAIQIGFSALGILTALILFFALSFARTQVVGDEEATQVLGILVIVLPIVFGVISVLGLVGGIGLFWHQSWARYMVLVVAAVGCLNIPFGTAKGIYVIWVLLQDETVRLFSGEPADTRIDTTVAQA
jgi:polyferredoxin